MEAGRQHYNLTLAVLVVAALAYALQQTMVVPALPALQHDLHTTTGWATWLLTGFLLTASVGTPLLGKLGDQYGKERLLLISLVIFLLALLLTSLLIAMTEGEAWGWPSGRTLGLSAAAAALLAAWSLVELRVAEPMVDMRMLAGRTVLFTNLTAFIAGFAMYSSFIL